MASIWTADSFRSEPTRAGSVFRELYDQEDWQGILRFLLRYQETMLAEHTRDPETYNRLFDGGLPQALLAFCLDRRIYAQPHFESYTKPHVVYGTKALHDLLHYALEYTEPTPGSYHPVNRPAYAGHMLENLPSLWNLLLELPYVLQSTNLNADDTETLSVRWNILHLVMAELELRRKMRGSYPPEFLDSLAPHVVIRCWLLATSTEMIMTTEHCLSILYFCADDDYDRITSLVGKAIALKTIEPSQFIERCSSRLRKQDVLDDELFHLLIDLNLICLHEKMAHARAQADDLILLLLQAAQRQLCHGEQRYELRVLERVFIQIRLAMPYGIVRLPHTSDFFRALFMLLGRATVLAALDQDDASLAERRMSNIRNTLSFLPDNLALEANSFMISPLNPTKWISYSSDLIGPIWNHAYSKLQSLSSDMAPHKSRAIVLWTDLAQKCKIDASISTAPPVKLADRGTWSKDMGCAWRECLCFGERPQHKLRQCTRCKAVLYCSTKCQKRDWTEGEHKSICRASS